ncbi:30S ribosomal protein S9 [Patescibacteria group bacterium]
MAKKFTYAVGRRKSSSARVRLYRGKDQSTVNDKPIGKYFPGAVYAAAWQEPFELTGTAGKHFVTVRVVGGGIKGQLDATIHGIARAFSLYNSDKFRAPLKKAGLLTRDSRVRERRKPGTGGRARKQKQSPKR